MLIKLKKAIYLKKIFGLFQFFYGGKRIQAIYHLRIEVILARQYLLKASKAKLEVSTATKARLAGACPETDLYGFRALP